MSPGTINLVTSKTNENPQVDKLAPVFKKASYILIIALVLSGIVVGSLYAYLQLQTNQLKQQQDTLVSSVTGDTAKESLLVAIKERIAVLDKILANQKHITALFTLLHDIVPDENLKTISLDDSGKVTLSADVSSIPQAVTMVDSVLTLGDAGKLTKAALVSFGLTRENTLEISLSFVPVL